MIEKIVVKNKTNWLLAFITSIGLLILSFLILVLIPLFSLKTSITLSVLIYLYSSSIPIGLFIFFLYIWLWNTFGKTVLEISSDRIKVKTKNKLFSKPKVYMKSEIQKIGILDLGIEKTKYHIRLNYLFSNANQSIIITKGKIDIRIVDWLTLDQAKNILKKKELSLQANSI